MAKIAIIGVLPESLLNFRGDLIRNLVSRGHAVSAFSEPARLETIRAIEHLGATHHSYVVQRNRLNPLVDLRTMLDLRRQLLKADPDVVLAYTIKPVIWGGLALKTTNCRARFICLITGTGTVFQAGGHRKQWLRFLVSKLYGQAMRRAQVVVFQNAENRMQFVDDGLVEMDKTTIVDGSGVNLTRFECKPLPPSPPFVFLTIARLLKAKGLVELAKAATIVKRVHPNVVFRVVGPPDTSPDQLPKAEVEGWSNARLIEYCGPSADVRPHLRDCHVFVLPSYHEGLPRTVLEAMATGRAILTTNAPGCRETVVEGENGFRVPVGDYLLLADRMIWLLQNLDACRKMGIKSRCIALERFDVVEINKRMVALIERDFNSN